MDISREQTYLSFDSQSSVEVAKLFIVSLVGSKRLLDGQTFVFQNSTKECSTFVDL